MKRIISRLRHHQPVTYQIRLIGSIGENWSDWLDNMTIDAEDQAEGVVVTTLTGVLADQSALHGVLRRLFNLGLALISVNCLVNEATHRDTQVKL